MVSPPLRPRRAVYRRAASIFETFDNVSMWLQGKCDPEYRAEWEARFGIGDDDLRRFADYKAIRKRYYPVPTGSPHDDPRSSPDGLFAPIKAPDRLAAAFYASDKLEEAFTRLPSFMSAEDIAALDDIYRTYAPRFEALFEQEEAYRGVAEAVSARLDAGKFDHFAERVARFYGVPSVPDFTIVYVHWPKGENVAANPRGQYLIMKYALPDQREGAVRDIEIPLHELVHVISARQPEAQKHTFTEAFLSTCASSGDVPGPKVIEEPLAVVFQKLFLRELDPGRFDLDRPWYGGDPWIDPMAKRILAPVEATFAAGGPADPDLFRRLGTGCPHPRAR